MTDRGLMRDYSRSRAVLMGCWDYAHLEPVRPAANSLKRMKRLLTGPLCGWPTVCRCSATFPVAETCPTG
jgi:hypothetical protein